MKHWNCHRCHYTARLSRRRRKTKCFESRSLTSYKSECYMTVILIDNYGFIAPINRDHTDSQIKQKKKFSSIYLRLALWVRGINIMAREWERVIIDFRLILMRHNIFLFSVLFVIYLFDVNIIFLFHENRKWNYLNIFRIHFVCTLHFFYRTNNITNQLNIQIVFIQLCGNNVLITLDLYFLAKIYKTQTNISLFYKPRYRNMEPHVLEIWKNENEWWWLSIYDS